MEMQQHFVTFYSPGTFVAETTTKPVDAWDVDAAVAMATEITERYGATPYGFRFTTRGREANDLDSKQVAHSPMYYLGGKVETIEEVFARNDPKETILRANMDSNGHKRIWTSTEGWSWTQPLNDDDVVLASVGRNAKRQDAEERLGPEDEHAVPSEASADAQPTPPSSNEGKVS